MQRLRFKVAAATLACVLSWGALEIAHALRRSADSYPRSLSEAGLFIPDAELGYRPAPGFTTASLPNWQNDRDGYEAHVQGLGRLITINTDGYRGPRYPARHTGKLRIVALGGSTTFGAFNDDPYTWPIRLERRLSTRIPAEVINGGVSAWDSLQNLLSYKRTFQYYNADILLLATWFNDEYARDLQDFALLTDATDYDTDAHLAGTVALTHRPPTHSFLNNTLTQLWVRRLIGAWHRVSYDRHPRPLTLDSFRTFYRRDRVWIRGYLRNLHDTIALARAANPRIRIAVLAMPTFFSPQQQGGVDPAFAFPNSNYEMARRSYLGDNPRNRLLFAAYYYHSPLLEEVLAPYQREWGFDLVPAYLAFAGRSTEERARTLTMDEMHLTDTGNDVLAAWLADYLCPAERPTACRS